MQLLDFCVILAPVVDSEIGWTYDLVDLGFETFYELIFLCHQFQRILINRLINPNSVPLW